jgi:hypothetical protein
MASDPNREMVELVARALGSLCQELVFVGGCATGLLLTDPARPPARATTDVDLIADVLTVTDYYQLQGKLKAQGFREVPEVSCRWRFGDLKVDVMPTKEKFLGFSNRWYPLAVERARAVTLPSGATILVVSPPLFLATKAFPGISLRTPPAKTELRLLELGFVASRASNTSMMTGRRATHGPILAWRPPRRDPEASCSVSPRSRIEA